MSYMLRHLLCTIFVRKTACQKYCFQILSPPKKRSYCESQKSGFGFYPKNPPRVWILWVDDPFLDLPPPHKKKKTAKSVFGFGNPDLNFPKNTALTVSSIECLDAPAVLPTRYCDDLIDFLFSLTPSTLNSQWIGKITTQQGKTSKVIKVSDVFCNSWWMTVTYLTSGQRPGVLKSNQIEYNSLVYTDSVILVI